MSGKPKKKLDYAGWSVDIFDNDTKIDKLLDSQGWTGFAIYFYLCQRAFGSDGYFYRWSFDDCASTARKMGCGIGSGTIQEVVGYCLQIGLFHKGLFEKWGVITSKGIQRSYWIVAATRRDKTVYKELWLLQSEECKGIVFVSIFNEMSNTNDHSQDTNSDKPATNETVVKESKVKGSKVEESKRKKKQAAVIYVPDEELNGAINDFVAYRKGIKKPMTDRAVTLLIEKLCSLSGNPDEQIAILNQSIVNGWQGIFPLKEENRGKHYGKTNQDYDEMLRKWAEGVDEQSGVCNNCVNP